MKIEDMKINASEILANMDSYTWQVLEFISESQNKEIGFRHMVKEIKLSQDKLYRQLYFLLGACFIQISKQDRYDQRIKLYEVTDYGKAALEYKRTNV